MRKLLCAVIALFAVQSVSAQVLERRYLIHDDMNRTYLIYIPSTYDPASEEEVPVIFAFHGINATDENLVGVGLNAFAEQENFIVVYPQAAIAELGFIAWNCGTVLASNIDDAGYFIELLDLLISEYNVDQKRVYVCGFSMGGMMSNKLACEYGDRIAALASVSGPLTNTVYQNCEPIRKMPVMHFHGLSDQTVAYFGNGLIGTKGAMATIQWWATRNGCDLELQTEAVPDTADEYYHVDRLTYPNCDGDYEVIHYRIQHWPHAWPGPSRNVYATAEIVKFFMRHELQVQDIVTSSFDESLQEFIPSPNPFTNTLDLRNSELTDQVVHWNVFNSSGQEMIGGDQLGLIETASWPRGIYFLQLSTDEGSATFKLLRQ